MADLGQLVQALQRAAIMGQGGAGTQMNANPFPTQIGVQPPSVPNAQPNYDFQSPPSQPDMNNPYVPEIQKLLETMGKKNAELQKLALAASAHQQKVPQQNPNPIRPGANLAAVGIGSLAEMFSPGAGQKGYQNFVGGMQNAENVRVQNETNQYQAQGNSDQMLMKALGLEIGGIQDQIQGQTGLANLHERGVQQDAITGREELRAALKKVDLDLERVKLDLDREVFERIKTPESAAKLVKMKREAERTAEQTKTEIKRQAKITADIAGVHSRAKLTDSQKQLVDKKVSNYDDEFKLRAANVHSQMAKRSQVGGTVLPTPNQERLMLQSLISLNKAQIKGLDIKGVFDVESMLKRAELQTEIDEATDKIRKLVKAKPAGASQPKPLPGSLPGTAPRSKGVTLPPGAMRVG